MQIKHINKNLVLIYKGHRVKKIINIVEISDNEFTLSIKYINEDGVEIFPEEVQVYKQGDSYDVSDRKNAIINGYEFKEVQGNTSGIITKNTEVIIIFSAIEADTPSSVDPELYEIPYVSYDYWNPKPLDTEDVIVPLYITDFYQKEYLLDDTSLRFKLRVDIDGEVTWMEDLPAGDYDLNLGKFEPGMHYFTVQVFDENNQGSVRLANDIWCINEEEYRIKDNEIYEITMNDLASHNITTGLTDTATTEQMRNNRMGLTQLLAEIRAEGYRKTILPNATYRVNRADRNGVIGSGNEAIVIPSGLTVDLNGSTIKLQVFDDTIESGAISMVDFRNCVDSHLINGTIEGDYAERQANGWITGLRGEGTNAIWIYGGAYNSLDNITITQVTGYNIMTASYGNEANSGSMHRGKITDNIKLINGEEVEKEGYSTSALTDISSNTSGYMVDSVWLAMGGLNGYYWDIDHSFYDENEQFMECVRAYQYRRCRIPQGAKYVRTTYKCLSEEVRSEYHHMNVPRYMEIKNCKWLDNRTCAAFNQFQHLLVDNCEFTRSGQSITACEIDIEDGWEQSQDFFLYNSTVKESLGSASLIDNAGLNHVVKNCDGFDLLFRYRLHGLTVRDNINARFRMGGGYMVKNSVRVFENDFITAWATMSGDYVGGEVSNYLFKNNRIVGKVENTISMPYKYCDVTINALHSNAKFIDCTIRMGGQSCYANNNIEFFNCNFELAEEATWGYNKFSFNALDVYRLYKDCTFNIPSQLLAHNYFNSGVFEGCVFNDTVLLKPNRPCIAEGELAFINCVFNGEISIDASQTEIQFIDCEFPGGIYYMNQWTEPNCKFLDEVPTIASYINTTVSDGIKYLRHGETVSLSTVVLPYYIDRDYTYSTNNYLASVSTDGIVTAGHNGFGKFNVITTSATGVSVTNEFEVVDVDCTDNNYYDTDGSLVWNTACVADNKYIPVTGGSSITVTSPMSVSYIHVAEYSSDKAFIKQSTKSQTSSFTLTLNSTTRYVRVAFRCGAKKTEIIYLYSVE